MGILFLIENSMHAFALRMDDPSMRANARLAPAFLRVIRSPANARGRVSVPQKMTRMHRG
jgi:hypothetical protein